MNLFWRKILRIPQTYLLMIAVGLGLGLFFHAVGIRPLTLILGSIISLAMLSIWIKQLSPLLNQSQDNLLDADSFREQLQQISSTLDKKNSSVWKKAEIYAEESQKFCQSILQKESVIAPELIETLYTILDLCHQLKEAILASDNFKTPQYQILAKKHLDSSLARLKETHDQLQQLQDQVLFSTLENKETGSQLPLFLQTLVHDNRATLETIMENTSKNGN